MTGGLIGVVLGLLIIAVIEIWTRKHQKGETMKVEPNTKFEVLYFVKVPDHVGNKVRLEVETPENVMTIEVPKGSKIRYY